MPMSSSRPRRRLTIPNMEWLRGRRERDGQESPGWYGSSAVWLSMWTRPFWLVQLLQLRVASRRDSTWRDGRRMRPRLDTSSLRPQQGVWEGSVGGGS